MFGKRYNQLYPRYDLACDIIPYYLIHSRMELFPHIKTEDKDVHEALMGEEKRQAEGLELIPSENYVWRPVR